VQAVADASPPFGDWAVSIGQHCSWLLLHGNHEDEKASGDFGGIESWSIVTKRICSYIVHVQTIHLISTDHREPNPVVRVLLGLCGGSLSRSTSTLWRVSGLGQKQSFETAVRDKSSPTDAHNLDAVFFR
jgi:hypothetical protein